MQSSGEWETDDLFKDVKMAPKLAHPSTHVPHFVCTNGLADEWQGSLCVGLGFCSLPLLPPTGKSVSRILTQRQLGIVPRT